MDVGERAALSPTRSRPWTGSACVSPTSRRTARSGSDVSLGKMVIDARAYPRGFGENHVLARAAGAAAPPSGGRPSCASFEVGGFPDGSLLDVVRTNHAVLRGYRGRSLHAAAGSCRGSLEYRLPLGPSAARASRSLPAVRPPSPRGRVRGRGERVERRLHLGDLKTAAGAALGADLMSSTPSR